MVNYHPEIISITKDSVNLISQVSLKAPNLPYFKDQYLWTENPEEGYIKFQCKGTNKYFLVLKEKNTKEIVLTHEIKM